MGSDSYHVANSHMPTSRRKGSDSIPEHSMWDLWWTKWHWVGYLCEYMDAPYSFITTCEVRYRRDQPATLGPQFGLQLHGACLDSRYRITKILYIVNAVIDGIVQTRIQYVATCEWCYHSTDFHQFLSGTSKVLRIDIHTKV
jgi:hypothetical protein